MQNAILKLTLVGFAAAALAGCGKTPDEANAASQDMAIDENGATEQDGNIAIETLPADESSETSNAELSAGAADPDNANDNNQ